MRKRRPADPPAAIARDGWQYHHLGIPMTPGISTSSISTTWVFTFGVSRPVRTESNGCDSSRTAMCRTS